MANEFVAKNGLISQNNTTVSGSLTVSGSIIVTGSLNVTGSAVITGSFTTNGSTILTSTQNITSTPILTVSGSVSASAALARSVNISPTLIASASNDILVAQDTNPTFNVGAFTGVQSIATRFPVGTVVIGTGSYTAMNYSQVPQLYVNSSTFLNGTVQLPGTMRIVVNGGTDLNFSQQSTVAANSLLWFGSNTTGVYFGNYQTNPVDILVGGSTASNIKLRVFNSGSVAIGSTTDNGYRLQVTSGISGSLWTSGSAVITGSLTTNGSTTLTSTQNVTSTPILALTGAVSASASSSRALNITSTLIASSSNDSLIALDIQPTYNIGSFTRYKNLGLKIGTSYAGYDTYANALNLSAEINGNAGINGVLNVGGDSSVINLWRSGAVANGMRIGANYTNPAVGHLYLGDGLGNKQLVLIASNGNVIIQNGSTFTDAGFRLDVQGTTRLAGATTITGTATLTSNTVITGSLILTGSLSMSLQTGTPVTTVTPNGYYRATINGAAVFIPFYV
jgi:uncharacterized membrane protein YhhN